MAQAPKKQQISVEVPAEAEADVNPHMAPNDGVDYSDYEMSGADRTLFQSEQAREATKEPEPDTSGPQSARISMEPPPRQVLVNKAQDSTRMVKVRPRESFPRFRVGKDWYQVQAGKEVLVPKHVAVLLEQKGYL